MRVMGSWAILLIFAFLTLFEVKGEVASAETPCEFWVAPSPVGDDANPGTIDQPWATLDYAGDHVEDNFCTVWFYPGLYWGGSRLTSALRRQLSSSRLSLTRQPWSIIVL